MVCKNCGTSYEGDVKFCSVCGGELVPNKIPVQQSAYQQPTYAPQAPYTPRPAAPVKEKNPGSSLGLAAMILGIISIVFSFIPLIGYLTYVSAIVAIVLGAIGKKKSKEVGMKCGSGTVGILLGIVCFVLNIVCLILGFIFGAFTGGLSLLLA